MSCQHNLLSLHHDIKCNPRAKLSIRASLYLRAGERSDCDKTQKLWMRGRRRGAVAALLHTGGRRNEGGPWGTPGVSGTLGTHSPKITSSLSAFFLGCELSHNVGKIRTERGNILSHIPNCFGAGKLPNFSKKIRYISTNFFSFFFSLFFFKFVRYVGLVSIHKRT